MTLTIAPGAVLKGLTGTVARTSLHDVVEGALSAVGSSGSPITFTSINDNSVGGGGGSGSPAGGDWYGILATGSGSIDLEHANFSYSRWGVQTNTTGSVTVKSNAFASQSQQAVGIFAAAAPTLQNNSSSDVAQGWQAFEVPSSSLDASRLGGNSATGTGEQVVGLGGTIATSSTLPAEPAAWQIGIQTLFGGGDGSLDVPSGVTLTIAPERCSRDSLALVARTFFAQCRSRVR